MCFQVKFSFFLTINVSVKIALMHNLHFLKPFCSGIMVCKICNHNSPLQSVLEGSYIMRMCSYKLPWVDGRSNVDENDDFNAIKECFANCNSSYYKFISHHCFSVSDRSKYFSEFVLVEKEREYSHRDGWTTAWNVERRSRMTVVMKEWRRRRGQMCPIELC